MIDVYVTYKFDGVEFHENEEVEIIYYDRKKDETKTMIGIIHDLRSEAFSFVRFRSIYCYTIEVSDVLSIKKYIREDNTSH